MKRLSFLTRLFLALLIPTSIFLSACKKDDDDPKTITQTVVDNPDFSYLEAAVVRAGLASTLSGTGPFTVFAPTNAAFRALGFDSEAEVTAADPALLKSILEYHVVSGRVLSTQLTTGAVATVSTEAARTNKDIFISTTGGVTINPSNPNFASSTALTNLGLPLGTTGNIKVTTADLLASNGVIHVVDKVILPPPTVEVMARAFAAQSTPEFSQLVNALVNTTLAPNGPLNGTANSPFTVFAPTNAAFEAISATIAGLTNDQVSNVLRYHVLAASKVYSTTLPAVGTEITMFNGGKIKTATGPALDPTGSANNVNLGPNGLNVVCSNGVIHVIGTVLLP
jgi:uncharacterized surface protein with fasciclin (FAS1) repeats